MDSLTKIIEEMRGLALYLDSDHLTGCSEAIGALASRLEALQGQPVAYAIMVDDELEELGWGKAPIADECVIPLYAAPQEVKP